MFMSYFKIISCENAVFTTQHNDEEMLKIWQQQTIVQMSFFIYFKLLPQ